MVAGLLSRFDSTNKFTVLWSDPRSKEILEQIVPNHTNITYHKPISSNSGLVVFLWSMFRLQNFLTKNNSDIVLNINHHFPVKSVKQIVYHLNLFRFSRKQHPVFHPGEIAERLRDWRARKALLLCDLNVFESRFLLEQAKAQIPAPNNPHIIYIGHNEQLDVPVSETGSIPGTNILALTSPNPHKDNPTLIRMLARLCEMEPRTDWHLTIAGGTNDGVFDDIKALAAKLDVDSKITWLGFCTHKDLVKISADALCLVSTSRVESFSMVALEAMSWGLPVVVANCSSMPESVADAGLLATGGDEGSFARQVIKLKNNPKLRDNLVRAGKKRCEQLTWTKAAKQFEAHFTTLKELGSDPE